jgi:chromate reductase
MNSELTILGIPGSLRRMSLNRALLRAAQEVATDGVTINIYDLGDVPLYNGDVEAAGVPQSVLDFVDAIRGADGLLIASPEYNYSISGVLKNALDWASRPSVKNPLRHKPIGIMGASGGQFGTVRSQAALRQILASNIEGYVMVKPEMLVTSAANRFDDDGNLTDDEIRERLTTFVEALAAWTRRMR